MPFVDVLWTEGRDNMPGLVGEIFFIPKAEVDISALIIEDDGVTTSGNIALKEGGKIITIYATENSGNLTDSDQGEIDGKYTQIVLTWFTPGSFKELEQYKRRIRNTPGLFISKDTDFQFRLMGIWAAANPKFTPGGTEPRYVPSLDIPGRVRAINGTQGARGGDRRGTTFEVEMDAPHAALFYTGDIPENGTEEEPED